jgi:hypothetical protein
MRTVGGALVACLLLLLATAAAASAKWSGTLTRASTDPSSGALTLTATATSPSYGLHLGLNLGGYTVSQISANTSGPLGYNACTPTTNSGLTTHNGGIDCSFGSQITQVTINFTTSPRYPDNAGAVAYDDQDSTTNTIPGPCGQLMVDPGPNQTTTVGGDVTLAGKVTGGCPDPGKSVTSTWSKASGPGNASIASQGSPQTTASFDQPGTYVLQLQATDGHTTVSKTVTITVGPPCETINSPEDICGQCPVITVVPAELKPALQGLPYAVKLDGNGGQAPYAFSPGGPLPAGLQISSTGLLHGQVTAPPGTYPVNLSVVDARDCSASNQATTVAPTGGLVLLLVVKPAFSVQATSHGAEVDLALKAPSPGTFSALATTDTAGAAAKHSAGHAVKYGTARVQVKKAGKVQLTLTPTSAGRRLLARHHRLKLTVAVTFKPRHGKASTRRLHLTVTRAG